MDDSENEPPQPPFQLNGRVVLILGITMIALILPLAMVLVWVKGVRTGEATAIVPVIANQPPTNTIPPEALTGLKNSLEAAADSHFQPLLKNEESLPSAKITTSTPGETSRKIQNTLEKDFATTALIDDSGPVIRILVQMPAPKLSKFLPLIIHEYGARVTPETTDSTELCEILISP